MINLLPSIEDVTAMSNGTYKVPGIKVLQREKIRKQRIKFAKKKRKQKKKNKTTKAKEFVQPKYYEYIKSKKWLLRRLYFFDAYGKKCAICDTKKNIDVHHISYRNLGNEPDEDLVSLCRDHHDEYHQTYGVKRDNIETFQFIIEKREFLEFPTVV